MYIGIDLGTSAVKIILMTATGTIVDEVSEDYPVNYYNGSWAEQDPEHWWQATRFGLKTLLERQAHLKAQLRTIGFSGQMHGMVALGESGSVLTPAILWCDQRTENECDEITLHFGQKLLTRLVGNKALTGFTAPKILWLKKNKPEIFNQVSMFLLPKDYINFKLSGQYVSDYSDASGTLLLDVEHKCYSKPMLDYIGISEKQLPTLHESYAVTGNLSNALKDYLGLTQDVTLVAGAGDQAAGAIGTGTVQEGIVSVTLGTSGVVFAAHPDFKVDHANRLHAFCHANGQYHTMGVMLSAASCLKWWAEQGTHEEIETLLCEIDDSISDIIFLPYLMGERTPYANPHARGAFVGLDMTSQRKDMTKALLEGVAFGLKDSLDLLYEMNIKVDEVRLIGGGAKSPIWKQLLSDVFGSPIVGINTSQGGALGAAILAAVGDQVFVSVQEACEHIIKTQDLVEPNHSQTQRYLTKHKNYRSLYQNLYVGDCHPRIDSC